MMSQHVSAHGAIIRQYINNPYTRLFFLAVRTRTAFQNLFEGTHFQTSKNKIRNKSSVSKFKEFSKLAHYL
jgi:predicted hotdog family 3-hydroxylacyl-ACP dehydratase